MCSQTRCRTRGSTPTCRAAISFLDESYFELILLLVVFLKSSPQHLTHSGLIQDENRRLVNQCHCQRKSPLLTSAQRSHLVIKSMRFFLTLGFMSVYILTLTKKVCRPVPGDLPLEGGAVAAVFLFCSQSVF